MQVKVESYAGYRGEERPARFLLGAETLEVQEILDRWFGPDHSYFRIRASDGNHYILRHSADEGEWTMEVFTRGPTVTPGP